MREVIDLRRLAPMAPAEAAALLAARMRDPQSGQDAAVLEQWLAQDEAHHAAWARAQQAFALFDTAGDDETLAALRDEARAAAPERNPPLWRGLAAAAVLVAMVTGGITFYAGRHAAPGGSVAQAGPEQAGVPAQVFRTATGEVRAFALPDGSRMTLDTASRVDLAFSPGRRDLTLIAGRAHFDVRHDTARPFAVHAGGREVVAVGTRFDVRLDGVAFRVALIEGRVKVSGAGAGPAPLFLNAGQQLIEEEGRKPLIVPLEPTETEQWRDGMATFRNETLANAAGELNRYSSDRLVIDPRIAALRVSGSFKTGDVARFAEAVAAIHPVRVVRRGAHEWAIVPAR